VRRHCDSFPIARLQPLVSILIPAFNAKCWIADTIRSALSQTWPRKEIIVVDDGSTDATLSIARQFASKGLKVIGQENQGACAARNNAFAASQGEYIQWLDADDLLAPDKIARQIQALDTCQRERTLLASAWGCFHHRVQRANFSPTALWCDLSPLEWIIRRMEQSVYMQTTSWLVSRELTEAAGPWDTRLCNDQDGEYFCRVILASDGVRFVPEAKAFYRLSGAGSVSYVGRSNRKLESLFLSTKLQVGYVRACANNDRTRSACLKFLHSAQPAFYPFRLDLIEELEEIARELGGRLAPPRLSWKYDWIRRCFGWRAARQAELSLRRFKSSVVNSWDKAMYNLENGIFVSGRAG